MPPFVQEPNRRDRSCIRRNKGAAEGAGFHVHHFETVRPPLSDREEVFRGVVIATLKTRAYFLPADFFEGAPGQLVENQPFLLIVMKDVIWLAKAGDPVRRN